MKYNIGDVVFVLDLSIGHGQIVEYHPFTQMYRVLIYANGKYLWYPAEMLVKISGGKTMKCKNYKEEMKTTGLTFLEAIQALRDGKCEQILGKQGYGNGKWIITPEAFEYSWDLIDIIQPKLTFDGDITEAYMATMESIDHWRRDALEPLLRGKLPTVMDSDNCPLCKVYDVECEECPLGTFDIPCVEEGSTFYSYVDNKCATTAQSMVDLLSRVASWLKEQMRECKDEKNSR